MNEMKNPSADLLLDLSKWIALRWKDGFHHEYSIKESSRSVWSTWRNQYYPRSMDTWWCDSIGQANKNYSWSSDVLQYEKLSKELQSAIENGDEAMCASVCIAIFKWGGVARKKTDRSLEWVNEKSIKGELCSSIAKAVYLLKAESTVSLEEFDGKKLIMNSATTKIFAAADPDHEIAIYDGRVGAALGLLTRKMLEEMSMPMIPQELMFMWGPPSSKKAAAERRRDPSDGTFKFKQLPNTSQSQKADVCRAELSRKTNQLIKNITKILGETETNITSLDVERALFMIGYDVKQPNTIQTPYTSQNKRKIYT
jgi:hypothetical protein